MPFGQRILEGQKYIYGVETQFEEELPQTQMPQTSLAVRDNSICN